MRDFSDLIPHSANAAPVRPRHVMVLYAASSCGIMAWDRDRVDTEEWKFAWPIIFKLILNVASRLMYLNSSASAHRSMSVAVYASRRGDPMRSSRTFIQKPLLPRGIADASFPSSLLRFSRKYACILCRGMHQRSHDRRTGYPLCVNP